MRIALSKAQRRLTIIWFAGSGFLFLLLLIQTLVGRYADKANEAWSWLLPTFMPTLSLMIGVLVANSRKGESRDKTVDGFLYRLSYILSIAYLAVVSLTILFSPFSSYTPLELMKTSNLWLAPIQGLVSASIGAFFVKSGSEQS